MIPLFLLVLCEIRPLLAPPVNQEVGGSSPVGHAKGGGDSSGRSRMPRLSPDGRWLAYMSEESGLNEVYVRPFPNVTGGKWLVSTNGGIEPVWAHSGRELFYKSGSDLMSAEVLSGTTFVLGDRKALFSVEGFRSATNRHMYDVTADDQRFVMIRNPQSEEAGQLIVVENFFEELKAKVGN